MIIVKLPKDNYYKINKLVVSPQEKNENVLNAVISGMNQHLIEVFEIVVWQRYWDNNTLLGKRAWGLLDN